MTEKGEKREKNSEEVQNWQDFTTDRENEEEEFRMNLGPLAWVKRNDFIDKRKCTRDT